MRGVNGMDAKTLDTYCPSCDRPVIAALVERDETLRVKGEPTQYRATIAVCPICGQAIGDSRVESGNLRAAYAVYSAAHGIMTPDQIRSLRAEYGLSVRDFSRFLGFGEQTVARYEAGSIPDESHDTTLKLAATPQGAASLLEVRRQSLPPSVASAVEGFVGRRSADRSRWAFARSPWPTPEMARPSSRNGYRGFDWPRVCEVVRELADRCHDLYKTKLQKAMFFVDHVSFERTSRSMTGLAYAHADYGPVMDGRERVVSDLVDQGVVRLEQKGWGEVVVPVRNREDVLSQAELDLVDEVAEFVDTFETAAEISDFSHHLDAWSDTTSGEIIDYMAHAPQVDDSVRARMESLGRLDK